MTSATEPEHWPTERMIQEGHADYATEFDLMHLPPETLEIIASVCQVDEFAPDECISCLAHTMVLEQRRAAYEDEAAHELTGADEEEEEDHPTPKLDNLLHLPSPFEEDEPTPIAEQFASKVAELSLLVEELLEGPPIPPPNVTQNELALLVVAAQRWIGLMESQVAQGIELSTPQQQILDATKELVTRLKS